MILSIAAFVPTGRIKSYIRINMRVQITNYKVCLFGRDDEAPPYVTGAVDGRQGRTSQPSAVIHSGVKAVAITFPKI